MTDDSKIRLTRRGVLASMGAVGAAAALGGAGTMAFFNDTESFTGNRLVAGELDLKMDWEESYNGQLQEKVPPRPILSRAEIAIQFPSLSDAEVEAHFRDQFRDVPDQLQAPVVAVDDVKPGDHGEVTFSLHLFDNPGYLWLGGGLDGNRENGQSEPENETDATGGDPGVGLGEFGDAARARIWYDENGDNVYQPGQEAEPNETLIVEDSLSAVLAALSQGIPLDGDRSTPERDCYPNSTTQYLGFEWWVPVEVGNEIQTDSAAFTLSFYAEQCRHNDGIGNVPE